ncbi:MAG: PssE/Cps14G family polysaccharide biosynthesis glycosyltransferase [Clostridium celatum]|nr:PssE/Cps14G family polysaccharide biosynthesis glycosyltransferase [Clostridium celatum]
MIFITVGTHEQGMDRLFIEIDNLIEKGIIKDNVFAQIGYSKYEPKNFQYKKMISYDEMDDLVKGSDIIITHGGPGSIFHPLQYGKIPIVVPRKPEFNEHVDNHQILFAKRLEKQKKIIPIYEIDNIKNIITNYSEITKNFDKHSNEIEKFIKKFEFLIKEYI